MATPMILMKQSKICHVRLPIWRDIQERSSCFKRATELEIIITLTESIKTINQGVADIDPFAILKLRFWNCNFKLRSCEKIPVTKGPKRTNFRKWTKRNSQASRLQKTSWGFRQKPCWGWEGEFQKYLLKWSVIKPVAAAGVLKHDGVDLLQMTTDDSRLGLHHQLVVHFHDVTEWFPATKKRYTIFMYKNLDH